MPVRRSARLRHRYQPAGLNNLAPPPAPTHAPAGPDTTASIPHEIFCIIFQDITDSTDPNISNLRNILAVSSVNRRWRAAGKATRKPWADGLVMDLKGFEMIKTILERSHNAANPTESPSLSVEASELIKSALRQKKWRLAFAHFYRFRSLKLKFKLHPGQYLDPLREKLEQAPETTRLEVLHVTCGTTQIAEHLFGTRDTEMQVLQDLHMEHLYAYTDLNNNFFRGVEKFYYGYPQSAGGFDPTVDLYWLMAMEGLVQLRELRIDEAVTRYFTGGAQFAGVNNNPIINSQALRDIFVSGNFAGVGTVQASIVLIQSANRTFKIRTDRNSFTSLNDIHFPSPVFTQLWVGMTSPTSLFISLTHERLIVKATQMTSQTLIEIRPHSFSSWDSYAYLLMDRMTQGSLGQGLNTVTTLVFDVHFRRMDQITFNQIVEALPNCTRIDISRGMYNRDVDTTGWLATGAVGVQS
ncbi:hypothetical protein FA15DRAFT_661796 [Coprinopsis marcescibilis]|uniref:F-box domain-containing protein n=1 Tax=Coprinopsis marcescibilis TaxID=230819 RepID=A0A5C3KAM6_COPMA|nr:hypothetical protein FA15DRAFT_661796 [Coprinopsis marcescibilis]